MKKRLSAGLGVFTLAAMLLMATSSGTTATANPQPIPGDPPPVIIDPCIAACAATRDQAIAAAAAARAAAVAAANAAQAAAYAQADYQATLAFLAFLSGNTTLAISHLAQAALIRDAADAAHLAAIQAANAAFQQAHSAAWDAYDACVANCDGNGGNH